MHKSTGLGSDFKDRTHAANRYPGLAPVARPLANSYPIHSTNCLGFVITPITTGETPQPDQENWAIGTQ